MTLLETYIQKLLENKWTAMLKAGKLSKDSIRRIQKAKSAADPYYVKQLLKDGKSKEAAEYLKKKGVVKSAKDWVAGVMRGNANLIKTKNIKQSNRYHKTFSGSLNAMGVRNSDIVRKAGSIISEPKASHNFIRSTGKSSIHVPSNVPKKYSQAHSILTRHEIDEARAAEKIRNALKRKNIKGATVVPTDKLHVSDEVLRRERELERVQSALYNRKAKALNVGKLRRKTGEYTDLGSSKQSLKNDIKRSLETKATVDEFFNQVKDAPIEVKMQIFNQVKSEYKPILQKKDYKRLINRFKKGMNIN